MNYHRREMMISAVHNTLKWCRPLTFVNGVPMRNQTVVSPVKAIQTIPGHLRFKPDNRIHVVPSEQGLKSPNKTRYDPLYSRTRRKLEAKMIQNRLENVGGGGLLTPAPTEKKKHNEEVRGLTALISFPGSGNTWLRYLLQQATGILTGSIYKDLGLMKSGFPAENICNASVRKIKVVICDLIDINISVLDQVLAVKTHEWGTGAFKMFSTAILLVRSPESAIYAEFNRQSAGHIGFASVERFTRTEGRCEWIT